ncbi:MAG: hypothetical protein HGA36_03795 [Candidatus Moranbacteria bacterium]|nr:hypothetical protein [Candidatus Moranbacteria bacterium]
MQKQIFKLFLFSTFFLALPNLANAAEDLTNITNNDGTIYFAHDFETGNIVPDQGTGSIILLGGNVNKPLGDYSSSCTTDTNNFHYSYFSNAVAAQGSNGGSLQSLITPYLGNCPNEAFLRDTTVVSTPLLSEYYVRWYQKWTGSFEASVQQKFAKFYNSENLNEKTLTGHLTMRPNNSAGTTPGATMGRFENFMPNLENHFDKDGCTPASGNIWISPVPFAGCYAGQNRGYDDSLSTTSDIDLELNRWYVIEIHSKLNTDPALSDAVYEIWIDGVLRFAAYNFKFKDGLLFNTPGTNQFEFQHVYYNRSNQDQSTYMDNLVIADRYIGPVNSFDVIAPSAPSGLLVM